MGTAEKIAAVGYWALTITMDPWALSTPPLAAPDVASLCEVLAYHPTQSRNHIAHVSQAAKHR